MLSPALRGGRRGHGWLLRRSPLPQLLAQIAWGAENLAGEVEHVLEELDRALGLRDELVGEIEHEQLLLWPLPLGEQQPTYASAGPRGKRAGTRYGEAMELASFASGLGGRGGGEEADRLAAEFEVQKHRFPPPRSRQRTAPRQQAHTRRDSRGEPGGGAAGSTAAHEARPRPCM